MPDVFIGLKEAAVFEGISYDTIKKRVQRNPQQYKTKMQPSEAGGREQVLVSVDSLTAKGRKAWRAAQKIDGRDVVIEKRTESAPWYVGVDLNHYTEQHKKAFYEAVELAARVQDFIDYDGPDRTAYAERYALGLGVGMSAPRTSRTSTSTSSINFVSASSARSSIPGTWTMLSLLHRVRRSPGSGWRRSRSSSA